MAVPFTFAPAQKIESAKVNANFQAVDTGIGITGGEIEGAITPNAAGTIDSASATKWWRSVYTAILRLIDTDASHFLALVAGSNLTANRTLTLTTGDSNRQLTLTGDASISGTNTGDQFGSTTAAAILGRRSGSSGAAEELTLGSNISMTGTTINVANSGGDVSAASTFGTDNVLVRSDGTSKGVQSTAIVVDDSNNVTGIATAQVKAGTGTARANPGGTVFSDQTTVANSGLTLTTFKTWTIPANTLSADGQALTVRFGYNGVANNNVKSFEVLVDGVQAYSAGGDTTFGGDNGEIVIVRKSSTVILINGHTTKSTTLSGTFDIVMRGQITMDGGDSTTANISYMSSRVRWEPAGN